MESDFGFCCVRERGREGGKTNKNKKKKEEEEEEEEFAKPWCCKDDRYAGRVL